MTAAEKEYGGALFALASEENLLDEVAQGLRAALAAIRGNPEYLKLVENPAMKKDERLALLDGAFRGNVHPYVLNFLKILCERGMLASLPGCCDEYRDSLYEARGILPVTAWTAAPLDEKQTKALTEKLEKTTGKQVLLTCRTDASLLGGVRLSYAGRELDGTVKGRLDKLREILTD